jgi:1,3-beta-glucan synthase
MRTLLMLLYATIATKNPYLIYFWITTLALCIAPFVFNPHQFAVTDFVIDYRYIPFVHAVWLSLTAF